MSITISAKFDVNDPCSVESFLLLWMLLLLSAISTTDGSIKRIKMNTNFPKIWMYCIFNKFYMSIAEAIFLDRFRERFCSHFSENSLNNTFDQQHHFNNNNHLTGRKPIVSASIMSTAHSEASPVSSAASSVSAVISGLSSAQPHPPNSHNGQLQSSLGAIKLENPGLLSTSYYATPITSAASFSSASSANEQLLNAVSYG